MKGSSTDCANQAPTAFASGAWPELASWLQPSSHNPANHDFLHRESAKWSHASREQVFRQAQEGNDADRPPRSQAFPRQFGALTFAYHAKRSGNCPGAASRSAALPLERHLRFAGKSRPTVVRSSIHHGGVSLPRTSGTLNSPHPVSLSADLSFAGNAATHSLRSRGWLDAGARLQSWQWAANMDVWTTWLK